MIASVYADSMSGERPEADATWDEHYRDERDAAFLYRQLAKADSNVERRELFERLAVQVLAAHFDFPEQAREFLVAQVFVGFLDLRGDRVA